MWRCSLVCESLKENILLASKSVSKHKFKCFQWAKPSAHPHPMEVLKTALKRRLNCTQVSCWPSAVGSNGSWSTREGRGQHWQLLMASTRAPSQALASAHGRLLHYITLWKHKRDIALSLSHRGQQNLNFIQWYLFRTGECFPYAVGLKTQHHITESYFNRYILRKTFFLWRPI